jgi:hypothetical protein
MAISLRSDEHTVTKPSISFIAEPALDPAGRLPLVSSGPAIAVAGPTGIDQSE